MDPPPPPLRIQLPGDIVDRGGGANDALPPLDPPPFDPARALECVRISQRVVNHDGSHEILILTSISRSLDEALDAVDRPEVFDDMEEGSDDDMESDDISSSSSTEDLDNECDVDGGERDHPAPNNQGFLEAFMVCWSRPIREVRHL